MLHIPANRRDPKLALHVLDISRIVCSLLFYAIATVFHDGDKMHEMKRRKPEPTVLPISRDLPLPTPYRHDMRGTGL